MPVRRNQGQVLIISTVLLTVVLGLVGAFVTYLGGVRNATNVFSARAAARQAARAGIEKAVWCLNQAIGTSCGGTYNANFIGETGIAVGNGYYTTTVTSLSVVDKTVTSIGYYPSIAHPIATVTLKADVNITNELSSFHYGVQTGDGGFQMANNSYVDGNIYAGGNVVGGTNVYVTGDVWVAGGTALAADQQQLTNNEDYTFGKTSPTIDIAQSFQLSSSNVINKISLYIKKVGSPSNATIRILADNNGSPSTTVLASASLTASSVTTTYGWLDVSFATPPSVVGGQTYWLSFDSGTNSNNYWITGSLNTNDYASGRGKYSADWSAGNWTDAGRDYTFKVWTGGNTTKIDTVDVKGYAHAHLITNSTVEKDAYYQTLTSTTVTGTKYPNSADPGPADFPLSSAQIADLESAAAAGGTINGDVTYDGTSNTLGPKKIVGNLTVTNGATLTMTGTLYVTGNLVLNNNSNITLASNYGATSGGFVVDGKISVLNGVVFSSSGSAGSYVILVTNNGSLDSNNPAMDLNQNTKNSIFYAPNGVALFENNATVKEVTAFKLVLQNGANITYDTGLANVNFSSGPGASWLLIPGTLREIH